MRKEKIKGGIMGVVIGDVLGLPVQFLPRSEIQLNPITEMRGGGTFDTPIGTWSDDSSLTLCLVDSFVNKGYDLNDIANRFVRWFSDGYCTPFGYAFDIGYGTRVAINRLIRGINPLEAGPSDENNNGNGSLMRILPAAIYFSKLSNLEFIEKVCEVSKITHGHPRSQLGCALYSLLVKDILVGKTTEEAYESMISQTLLFEGSNLENELVFYERLLNGTLLDLTEDKIYSSGYIVHTLEAAVWSFLTSKSYKETVLKAVNLGFDTDTVGAVAGGLAGVYYGLEEIPEKWLAKIVKLEYILDLSQKFADVYRE